MLQFLVLLVYFGFFILHPVPANGQVTPTPSNQSAAQAGTLPQFVSSVLFDCKNIPSGSVFDRYREHCRSLNDPQSGFPYHTCKVIKDPITDIVTSSLKSARSLIDSMLPTWLVNVGVTDILLGTSGSTVSAINGAINVISNAFFINQANKEVRFGYDAQFVAGCNTGSMCAQAVDMSSEGIIGDNVCIPLSEFQEYKTAKKQLSNGQPNDLGKILDRMFQNKESIYRSKPLAELCIRNTPNGSNILDYILLKKSGVDLNTNFPIVSHLDSFHNEMYLDQFYTDKLNWKIISDNMDEIEKVFGKVRISSSGLPMILWFKASVKGPSMVNKQELRSLSSCLQAASEGKLYTAIGNIDIENLGTFISTTVFGILMGFAGAFTLGCAIYSGVSIQMSQGGEGYTKARETLMHCLSGLALVIFATFLLRFIGVDILRLPGLG